MTTRKDTTERARPFALTDATPVKRSPRAPSSADVAAIAEATDTVVRSHGSLAAPVLARVIEAEPIVSHLPGSETAVYDLIDPATTPAPTVHEHNMVAPHDVPPAHEGDAMGTTRDAVRDDAGADPRSALKTLPSPPWHSPVRVKSSEVDASPPDGPQSTDLHGVRARIVLALLVLCVAFVAAFLYARHQATPRRTGPAPATHQVTHHVAPAASNRTAGPPQRTHRRVTSPPNAVPPLTPLPATVWTIPPLRKPAEEVVLSFANRRTVPVAARVHLTHDGHTVEIRLSVPARNGTELELGPQTPGYRMTVDADQPILVARAAIRHNHIHSTYGVPTYTSRPAR
ncbi:MAG: hypothetical protein NVS2B16_18830 [Chloroflexota bacterium]